MKGCPHQRLLSLALLAGLGWLLAFLFPFNAPAAVHYVDLNSTNPTPPYTNWSTAATNIQDAVDVATNGDTVLVTNGVYATGGRKWFDSGTNRVTVTNLITLQSVNGPAVTVIQGRHASGASAVRCVLLEVDALLSGFTLTNGQGGINNYPEGGGVYCNPSVGAISNCVLTGNLARSGGGAYRGTLVNCTLTSNMTTTTGNGGGAYGAILLNSVVSNNTTISKGGGVYSCTLSNCVIAGNRASALPAGIGSGGGADTSVCIGCVITNNFGDYGGGANGSTLLNCIVSGNLSMYRGGGASSSALLNCIITSNIATNQGGGVYSCTLTNCLVAGNRAFSSPVASGVGGGAYGGTLNNCTVVNNFASQSGGGIWGNGDWTNCIVYYNSASSGANYDISNLSGPVSFCCTTPLPLAGQNATGNITNEPNFVNLVASDFHLQTSSPCINAGNNSYAFTSTDLDGNPRIISGTVDIGAFEAQSIAAISGLLALQAFTGSNCPVRFIFSTVSGGGTNYLQTNDVTLSFTNGVAAYSLPVPTNTTHISAKTAWHLRKRQSVSFTNGVATVDFTSANNLRAGDLALGSPGIGNTDNAVTASDYLLLLGYYLQPVNGDTNIARADLNGDGMVGSTDYLLLLGNYLTSGDSP